MNMVINKATDKAASGSPAKMAIRFIGFQAQEASILEATLAVEQSGHHRYFRLPEGSLQDVNLFMANGDDLAALATLAALGPSELRPALLIGKPPLDLPYPWVPRPIRWGYLFEVLDQVVAKRQASLARLEAAGRITVPERRRRGRVDFDLTDPAKYMDMRRRAPVASAVLVVDKTPVFANYLADLLRPHSVSVVWVGSAVAALEDRMQQVWSLVLINTETPEVQPYQLCDEIKKRSNGTHTAVVFLVDKAFSYDRVKAEIVGCDGFLVKPLSSQQLVPVLDKFLPRSR